MRCVLGQTFSALSGVALLLCVAVCVLWVPARQGSDDRISVRCASGRYAVRFDRDRVRLIGPPRPPAGGQEALGWTLAGQIRNRDLGWSIAGKYVNGMPVDFGYVMDSFHFGNGAGIAYGTPSQGVA